MSSAQCTTKKNEGTNNCQMGSIPTTLKEQVHESRKTQKSKEKNFAAKTNENIHSNMNHQPEIKKRGLKPRSKRNRKKARGGGVLRYGSCESNDESDDYSKDVNIQIVPLFHNNPTRKERIRIIEPYFFRFSTFVKQRWVGRTVLDVYTEEFGSYPKSYYEAAILSGRIMVNSKKVQPSYALKAGNEMTHTVHRHEPAIAVRDAFSCFHNNHIKNSSTRPHKEYNSEDINNLVPIIYEDDNIIVVDKPATVPIHPCGGYNFNSLFHLLSKRQRNGISIKNEEKLYTIHRLDRLTSGLLICAKSSQVANELGKCIMDRTCQKLYLARVKGKFPKNACNNPNLKNLKNVAVGKDRSPPDVCFGEYTIDEPTSQLHDVTSCVPNKKKAQANKNNNKVALGYWITDINNLVLQKNGNEALEEVFLSCAKNQKLSNDDHMEECQLSSSVDTIDCSSKDKDTINKNHIDQLSPMQPISLHLACPCRISSPKIGICEAGAFPPSTSNVKPAQTSFTPLLYHEHSDTTIVLCNPATGRTHQIRLHLQYLGHPIANDPNYGGELWYADEEGRSACKRAEERMNEMDINSGQIDNETKDQNKQVDQYRRNNGKPKGAISTDIPATEEEIRNAENAETIMQLAGKSVSTNTEMLYDYIKKSCVWCRRSAGEERKYERSNLEFLVRSPGIWLHALQYSFKTKGSSGKSFKTRYPKWALIQNE